MQLKHAIFLLLLFFLHFTRLICTMRLNWSSITNKKAQHRFRFLQFRYIAIRSVTFVNATYKRTCFSSRCWHSLRKTSRTNPMHTNNTICETSERVKDSAKWRERDGERHSFIPILPLYSVIPATGLIVIDAFHISRIFASDPFRCFYFLQENYINKRREKKVIFVPQ